MNNQYPRQAMHNISPYWDHNFFQFFYRLGKRILSLFQEGTTTLASDELQLIVLLLLSIPTALLGVFIALRKMTMLANSLSHTILLGIVLAYLLIPGALSSGMLSISSLCIASLFSACLTVIITEGAIKLFRLQKDASIGLVFTGLFSLGIILVGLFTKNTHLGTEIVMGNIDALHPQDIKISALIFQGNLLFLSIFFRELYYTTFDTVHTRLYGMRPNIYHYLLILFLAGTSIAAFRAVGIVLFLSFLTGPFLIMRLFASKIRTILFGTFSIVVLASLFGVATSRHFLSVYNMPLSTSGLVVFWITLFYFLGTAVQFIKERQNKKLWKERATCER